MVITRGIYQIRNIENNKVYIGSSKDIMNRWKSHVGNLNKNEHHSKKLQDDWNKYGEVKFVFEVLEIVNDTDNIFEIEEKYIEKYSSHADGYNMTSKVTNSLNSGIVYENDKLHIVKTISKFGNSLGVRLPSEYLKYMNLINGDPVYISLIDGKIIISSNVENEYHDNLKEKVIRIVDEYLNINK